jgi:enoyl-CoA hydratase
MPEYKFIQTDDPEAGIRRISLNRPEKRNALSNPLRRELFDALREADADTAIGAIVIRGNGKCFSAGYDLAQSPKEPLPRVVSPGEGTWPRHLVDGWFEMWDMATPIIAQVHGYCLAGGTELATACDLVYVAEDAQIGYPAGARDVDAGLRLSSLADGDAQRDGDDADGRFNLGDRSRADGLRQSRLSGREAR